MITPGKNRINFNINNKSKDLEHAQKPAGSEKNFGTRNPRKKKRSVFSFLLLLELVLLVSIAASIGVLKFLSDNNSNIENTTFPHYKHILENYKIIDDLRMMTMRTEPINDPEFEINDPFILDVFRLKDASQYLREKKFQSMADIILKMETGKNHPFIVQQKNKLYLKYLYHKKKYNAFIECWNQSHPSIRSGSSMKVFLLNSYINTKKNREADELFKSLLHSNGMGLLERYIGRQTLKRFAAKIDYDSWYSIFKQLAHGNRYTEFKRMRKYIKAPQLLTLFSADFAYQRKAYSLARKLLRRVTGKKLQGFKERILLKLDLREDNFEGFDQKLASIRSIVEPEVYRQLLLDAGSISLIKAQPELAQELLNNYIEVIKIPHQVRDYFFSFNPGPQKILDSNYWKAMWLSAWLYYRNNQKARAAQRFEEGLNSPLDTYRNANTYWYRRLKFSDKENVTVEDYPFSYYFVKNRDPGEYIPLQGFTNLLNHPRGPGFDSILEKVKRLVHYNLLHDASRFIQWSLTNNDNQLTVAGRHTLMLLESIVYLKKENYAMAFIRFRDNFECYRCIRLPRFLREIALPVKFSGLVEKYSEKNKLEKELVYSLIREESYFRPDAVSYANAYGLMQLLLKTARQMAYPYRIRLYRRDLFKPEINIRFGTEYLRFLLDKYDDKVYLALAAYNAGDHRVDEWLSRFGDADDDEFIEMIPFTATRNYVKNILRNYHYYKYYYGKE
jgi:hypothetical protein